jgi:hypothetical protein
VTILQDWFFRYIVCTFLATIDHRGGSVCLQADKSRSLLLLRWPLGTCTIRMKRKVRDVERAESLIWGIHGPVPAGGGVAVYICV